MEGRQASQPTVARYTPPCSRPAPAGMAASSRRGGYPPRPKNCAAASQGRCGAGAGPARGCIQARVWWGLGVR